MTDYASVMAVQVHRNHKFFHQRTGQYLMNLLPNNARSACTGNALDIWEKELSMHETYEWITNHVIFSKDGDIIGFFDGDDVIWEADPPPDMGVPATVRG